MLPAWPPSGQSPWWVSPVHGRPTECALHREALRPGDAGDHRRARDGGERCPALAGTRECIVCICVFVNGCTSRVSGLCRRLAQPGGGCATSVGGPRWRCPSRSLCGRRWVFVMSESGPPDHRAAHVSLSLSVLPAPAAVAADPLGSCNPPSCAHGAARLSVPRRSRMRAPPCAALPLAVCPLPVPRSSPSRSPSLSGCLPMASSSTSS